jgi:diphosphomevalonate decarboxylase
VNATAVACANIALVKYWGKRDEALNLPARGSLSVTLDALETRTTVTFDAERPADVLVVDGIERAGAALARAARVLDLLRARAGVGAEGPRALVTSANTFPYGAGLASSASGMAALVTAGAAALGLDLDPAERSVLARRGSGSAARSIHGGFVEWRAGERPDGADSVGVPLHPAAHWELRVVVAVVAAAGEKAVPSTEGMRHTAATSPYQPAWLAAVDTDLVAARAALAARDLAALGAVAERSALRMHAAMLAADPALLYWRGATVEALHTVRALRARDGLAAWATIDAGPHVKVLTTPADAPAVAARLAAVPGVERVVASRIGGPARVEANAAAERPTEVTS